VTIVEYEAVCNDNSGAADGKRKRRKEIKKYKVESEDPRHHSGDKEDRGRRYKKNRARHFRGLQHALAL
jgi:hypothetical protein